MTDSSGAFVDFAQHRAPIYTQLSTLFRRFIVTGQWPVEARIPTHEDLAAQFEVNPATIRKAIALLESEGLLQAARRRGTVVIAKPSAPQWFDLPTKWKTALRMYDGLSPHFVDSTDAKQLPESLHEANSSGLTYRRMRRIWRRDAIPVAFEDLYLDQTVRARIGDVRLRQSNFLEEIDQCRGLSVVRVDQTLRFGIANGELARMLELPLNAPVGMVSISVIGKRQRLICDAMTTVRGDLMRISEPIDFLRHH